jgi:Bacterial regulatory protein, Fis family
MLIVHYGRGDVRADRSNAKDRSGGTSGEIDEMREYPDIMEALKVTRGNKRKAAILLGMPLDDEVEPPEIRAPGVGPFRLEWG